MSGADSATQTRNLSPELGLRDATGATPRSDTRGFENEPVAQFGEKSKVPKGGGELLVRSFERKPPASHEPAAPHHMDRRGGRQE